MGNQSPPHPLYDQTIRLWDINSEALIHSFDGHTDWVNSVAFSPDGQSIAFASHDQTIQLWDINSKTLTNSLKGHTSYVTAIAFSPGGQSIVSASFDQSIRLWDVGTQLWNHKFIGGLNNSWFSQSANGKFLRADTKGTLFLTKQEKHYSPPLPASFQKPPQDSIAVEIVKENPSSLTSFNIGEIKSITLSVENRSQQTLLWVKPVLQENTPFVILQAPVIYKLAVGETKTLEVQVSPHLQQVSSSFEGLANSQFLKNTIEPYKTELKINVVAPEKAQSSINVPTQINTPQLKISSATVLDSGFSRVLNLTIENYSEHFVENTVLNLEVVGIDKFDPQTITGTIPAKATVERAFSLPIGFELTKEAIDTTSSSLSILLPPLPTPTSP